MAERGYASVTISEVLDGYNQATVMLYARGASAPALPSSAVTYTFETGALSSVPANWSRSVPTANGYPCWVIIAWPVGRDSTCSIATTDWSTATKLVEDGDDAYTVILTNESHTFVGDTTKAVAGSTTIGVQAFKGSTQVAATIGTITGQVTGLTTSISNNNSLTASVTVTVTTSLTTQGGTLTIPITVDAVTVNKIFSWTLKLNGKDGTRGATWYSGTGITGTSTTPTVFSGSGVSSALVGDHYLNTSTQNIYVCTTAGSASAAKWKYEENIKGATGKGITSITPMYYLSTANDSQTGGSWETTPPVYQVGRYYWTKQSILWTDGTTTDTTPTLDNGLNAANSSAEYARLHAEPSLGMKINYSTFSIVDSGEVYLHGYTNSAPADVNGYIMWNGVERTVSKGMINPNAIVPYNRYIYIVLRLTSASSTSGTLYMVWYNSGWKYAVTPTPTAVGGTWTWDEAKDVVLGQFIEPGSEQDLVEAYLYNPPRTAAQVKTTNPSPYQYSQSAVEWYNSNGQTTVNANTMLAAWADGAFSATTEIDGGFIKAHTIQAEHLATDAIMSNNFQASSVEGSPFSAAGTFLDLTTGNLYSPNFGIDNSYGVAYLNGEIIATSGRIGNSGASNYWEIGTKVDYNQAQSAAIIGHGTSYIQSGEWQLSNNRLDSRSYNAQNQITYPYANSTYYDFGINMPTLDTTLNHESYPNGVDNLGHNDNFIYIRTAENSIPQLETNWNYVFRIDKSGMIWINGQSLDQRYALATGVDGTYLPLTGGVITGNLTVNGTLTAIASQATKLANARTFITNLASTSTGSFDGQANVSLGVTGTLGVGNGGTGRNTLTSGSALIGNGTSAVNFRAITNNTSATYITANDNLITANTLKFWKGSYDSSNNSNIEYVKLGKLGTAAIHDIEDFITVGGGVIDGSLSVTDLTAGSLVVNGAARFVNGAIGDLTGNASTATTLATARTIQTNLASTSAASFNGSANVTPGVTGTLGVANGGTGQTSANAAANAFIDSLADGSSVPVDGDTYIASYADGKNVAHNGVNTYHRRPISNLWSYMNSKINSVLGLTASAYGGNAASANQVNNNLIIKLASGTTEGTNMFTYNGSAGKTINITKASIGLGNVENKGVDTSIAAASTSTNLPTSQAVAAFVEGKGYITNAGVTSVSGTSPVSASGTASVTISLANGYGDTKNPYGNKNINLVLASPASGSADAPTFRALVENDIPTLSSSKVGLGSVTNNKQVKGLASGTTNGHFVTWGSDGYTVADSGYNAGQVVKSLASNNDGKLVLTYLDNTTSAPIEVKIIGSSGSSVSYADALNVNGTAVGSATQPVYINNQGKPVAANSYPTTTLNGTATTAASFYAPTGAGTNNYVLKSNGSGAPSWVAQSTLSVGSASSATTATKFSSARSITLSGDTTGTVSSDGTSGWSITTKTDRISTVGDNRTVATKPNDYANKIIFQGLKTNSYIGSPATNTYSYLVGLRGWSDQSGGKAHELAFNDSGIFHRIGSTTEWDSWNKLVTSGNYTDYTVTKTGTGASGTWGIGISGNAATATKANITTTTNAIAKYSDTAGTFADSNVRIENNDLIIGSMDGSTAVGAGNIKIGVKNDNYGIMPNVNNYNQIGASGLAWYRAYVTNYYGTTSHVSNWDSGGNIGSPSSSAAASTRGTVNFYNTCAAGGTQTKTSLTADSTTASNITLTLPKTTGTIALTSGDITGNAATATTATSSYHPRLVSNNEIRFHIDSKPSNTINLYIGYKWSDGTFDEKINRYIFYNGNATLAEVQASTFYGALSGNATSATKATNDSDGNAINSTYLKLSGGTMTGAITLPINKASLIYQSTSSSYGAGFVYGTSNQEAFAITTKQTGTSFMIVHGSDFSNWNGATWESVSPTLQTKQNSLYVHELIPTGTAPTYNFKVNGTSYLGGNVKISHNNADTESVSLNYDNTLKCLNFVFA